MVDDALGCERGADAFVDRRTTSSTRSRSPMRAVTVSPGRTVVDALAPAPFTLTCPARHSAVDDGARRCGPHRPQPPVDSRDLHRKASHERAPSAAQ